MQQTVSIIIPALNEEKYLPRLLTAIKEQTRRPDETIVVDAFSTDKTREIAKHFGCKIIDGGNSPAISRNRGASAATSDILVFLDADTLIPPNFLEKNLAEFSERKLDEASCLIEPIEGNQLDDFVSNIINSYFYLFQSLVPHANGFGIFAKRIIHEKIKGFDETLKVTEDHDYAKRASRVGKVGFLKSRKIQMSMRRYAEEGRFKAFLKYAYIELHWLLLGKIQTKPFAFEFGKHTKS